MIKRCSSFALAGLVLHSLLWLSCPVAAQSNSDPQLSARVKADVASLGVGIRVAIKLRDKQKFTGYLSQIGENDFVVTTAKAGTNRTIAYAEVKQIKQKNEKHVSATGIVLGVIGMLWVMGLIANGGG